MDYGWLLRIYDVRCVAQTPYNIFNFKLEFLEHLCHSVRECTTTTPEGLLTYFNSAVQSTMWWKGNRQAQDAPSIIPRYTKYGSTKQKNIYILHSALLTWKDNIILLTSVNNIPQQLHTHYEHVPQETQKITTAPSSLIICWGQGTLKLPMSFSKFSLCPPLGAACHMLQWGKEMWKWSLEEETGEVHLWLEWEVYCFYQILHDCMIAYYKPCEHVWLFMTAHLNPSMSIQLTNPRFTWFSNSRAHPMLYPLSLFSLLLT